MVRRGSPVRVRQRAPKTAETGGFLVVKGHPTPHVRRLCHHRCQDAATRAVSAWDHWSHEAQKNAQRGRGATLHQAALTIPLGQPPFASFGHVVCGRGGGYGFSRPAPNVDTNLSSSSVGSMSFSRPCGVSPRLRSSHACITERHDALLADSHTDQVERRSKASQAKAMGDRPTRTTRARQRPPKGHVEFVPPELEEIIRDGVTYTVLDERYVGVEHAQPGLTWLSGHARRTRSRRRRRPPRR